MRKRMLPQTRLLVHPNKQAAVGSCSRSGISVNTDLLPVLELQPPPAAEIPSLPEAGVSWSGLVHTYCLLGYWTIFFSCVVRGCGVKNNLAAQECEYLHLQHLRQQGGEQPEDPWPLPGRGSCWVAQAGLCCRRLGGTKLWSKGFCITFWEHTHWVLTPLRHISGYKPGYFLSHFWVILPV